LIAIVTFFLYFVLIVAGKYGDGPSKSDEWFAQGKMVCHYFLLFVVLQLANALKNGRILAPLPL
jgi:hypothetical protein